MAKKINYADMYTLRKDGRYQGYWRDQSGKRHTICDRDPAALYDKIQQKEARPPLTYREIAEAWHDAHWEMIKDGTKACYSAPYQRSLDDFGDRRAAEIEPSEIYNSLLRLNARGFSAKCIKTQRTVIKLAYQHAIIDPIMGKEIMRNPAADVPLPKNMKKPELREAPEDEIIRKIRANYTAYFGLFPLFLISTGFRRGEALAIRWRDIDFNTKQISCSVAVSHRNPTPVIVSPKTDAGIRVVPLLPDLLVALQKPTAAKPTDFVFYGADPSKPMPASTYNRRWMHYCKEMGFVTDTPETRISKQKKTYVVHHYKSTITAHVLRHGYATILFEAGVDEFTAQRLLGHANIEITRSIYTHLREKKKQASLDALNAYVVSAMKEQN